MNEQRSQELVVGALAAAAVVSAGSGLATHNPPGIRFVVGFAGTGLGLAVASLVAPDVAGTAALLILTTTVFVYGQPFMDAVTKLTGRTSSAARTTTTTTTPTLDPNLIPDPTEGLPA